MEIFKTFVTLFSLCLFHSTLIETQTQGMCKGNLPPVKYVALNSNVTVNCPTLSAPLLEMDFTLYKGLDEVTNICININDTIISNCNNRTKRDFPAYPSVNGLEASFVLFRVAMNITALYTCEARRNFPPPFVKVEQTPQTIVFVEENPSEQHCQHISHLVLWGVLGGMTIYGLVMTCIVLMLRSKLSQMDSGFYGLKNIKFRECRQKWQGVQHPTWQGFYIDTVA